MNEAFSLNIAAVIVLLILTVMIPPIGGLALVAIIFLPFSYSEGRRKSPPDRGDFRDYRSGAD